MRTFVPRTPGLRHLKQVINDHLWKRGPFTPLTYPKIGHAKGGRNNTGHVTVRHRGGGHRRRIRTIDWHRLESGEQLVERIEYDPNRSAHIALLTHKQTGSKSYVVASVGLRAGDTVQSYRAGIPASLIKAMGGRVDPGLLIAKTIVRGNCLPVQLIPQGTQIHSIGSMSARGAVFCRSAGTYATVLGRDESSAEFKYMVVRLQSGEVRKVSKNACATIGIASNPMHQYRQLGKAGRSRWLNIRPSVRGVAMNSCDHPHGGGRGKSKGNRIPVSPWGQPAKSGYKTRKKTNENKWIVRPRERNHGKRRSKT
ncbi:ribosomal protein L2 [Microthyrium microscopicum]|uniref:Large ribosomal subunit protein uL2m n=1 Tax=Microthyrium microscopicum TaxID=703497 RepID=A0A6A6U5B2_9PEZI|nr:ribosomal protein L2 [Microthyrium microscopicum]